MQLTNPTDPPSPAWLAKIALIVNASVQSGTTAQRPAAGLFIGRFYFDTTLAKPIWIKQLLPLLWADATGATV